MGLHIFRILGVRKCWQVGILGTKNGKFHNKKIVSRFSAVVLIFNNLPTLHSVLEITTETFPSRTIVQKKVHQNIHAMVFTFYSAVLSSIEVK